ncbi:lipopolysaccharide kinase InaA family protein [Methylophaga muralis]|uniref:lipopolysaccharide kinase InaA family protein n=1 Tax=Methylophaga muralis TaxID=291169 RepID=UPI00114CCBDE
MSKQIPLNDERVFDVKLQGSRFWIKQAEASSSTIWHYLSSIIAKISDNPLFTPTVTIDGNTALTGEIQRINQLKNEGASVPQIIASGENWFATADHGITLQKLFKRSELNDKQLQHILEQAAIALANLHNLGAWHGRPALKDILWDGEKVTLIDFEENPISHLTPVQCMSRDLFLFMHSVVRFYEADNPVISAVWNRYCENAAGEISQSAINLAKSMPWLFWLSKLSLPIAGNDVRQTYKVLYFLRKSV